MSKTRSMDEEDFWAPAVFGLIIAIIFLLILGALNFVIMENREILVGLQMISFGIFLLWHIGEQHYAWYELPGGIPGRVAILTLYSPGAWPLFVLAGTLSLVIFLINEKEKRGRKRVEIKQNSQPAPAFSEDRSLLEKLQARLDTVIKGKKQ